MGILLFSVITIFAVLSCGASALAQTSIPNTFTANLSLGSSGTQVVALQKILNRALDTRIANVGPGSPGNETAYFGALTKAAVVRFQEKYMREVLMPVELMQGNGRVGYYTRVKLNALSASTSAVNTRDVNSPVAQSATMPTTTSTPVVTHSAVQPIITPSATSTSVITPSVTNYLVNDSEKIDIYAGDTMLENVRNKIYAAINSAIAAQSATAIALPAVTPADVPSVTIGTLSPQFGVSGTRVSIQGDGISSNSVVYFGSKYIIRAVSRASMGKLSFIVPPIPPARYDIAIRAGDSVSNTATFVITDPQNPLVRIQSISPSTISYSGTLTIIGSGFSPQGNVVVTTYQKFANVSSTDGKTLIVQLAPVSLQASAKIGNGKKEIPMSLYVVNDYGFAYLEKPFIMTL